jgi:hypothetical protein
MRGELMQNGLVERSEYSLEDIKGGIHSQWPCHPINAKISRCSDQIDD